MDMKVKMKYEQKYRLGTGPLSTEDCVSPEYFAKEKELLFKRVWLCIGRDEDIPEVGSYLVRDIEVLDTSIIVTRDKDNKVKAFHNICTHRLNKLVQPGMGKVKAFTCGFHGWAFGLDGKLVHSSNEDLFPSFDRDKLGLVSVHADVWNGFIFINVAKKPRETLREQLGEMADQFDNYFEHMELRSKWHVDVVNCNWKLYVDANTEAYHGPFLHARSLGDAVVSKDNPDCHFNDVKLFGKNRTASTYANPDYKPSLIEGKVGRYAKTPLYPATSATTAALPPGINAERNPLWVFDLAVFFPNLELVCANGWYQYMLYWPLSEGKTRFERCHYMYKPTTVGDVVAQEFPLVHGRDVQREDMSTLEGTQQMLRAGVLKEMQICDEEITLRHNHLSVAQYMAE